MVSEPSLSPFLLEGIFGRAGVGVRVEINTGREVGWQASREFVFIGVNTLCRQFLAMEVADTVAPLLVDFVVLDDFT